MHLAKPPRPLSASEIAAFGLRPREVEVLYLIAAGLNTAEISDALYISANSVKTHTKALYGKLGVNSRLKAAVWLWSRADDESCLAGG